MNLCTVGTNFYPGYTLYMAISEGLTELNHEDFDKYYKIIYIRKGFSHFSLNNKEYILTGTYAICLNETDNIKFYNIIDKEAKILFFKPSVLNSRFTYNFMKDPSRQLTITDGQDLSYIRQFAPDANENMKILSLHAIDSAGLEYKFQVIQELLTFQAINSWPCKSRSYLLEILFCLIRLEEEEDEIKNTVLNGGGSNLAVEVIYYLQSCYNKKITVVKLADIFHTNRTTLMNDFKKFTGNSINQYLIELRLKMASAMLRDTELSIEEICDRTGFNDISYFSKVFKKGLSYTPSEYRRIHEHSVE